ncbi:membrane-associated apoptosis protein-domain-containing protein [Catenaria anguillulae PL171]|uniref:Membrane-associated apoptosis protein-domain-containing protein n=1 Tax=Catenaria anguillulae PL171 TaxID=765915 RepID=A0A1Y2HJ12_9FUNG|nr:membrane-associated apoptosis protein-domain-containing protein [Catenaria anguillulae PL171]
MASPSSNVTKLAEHLLLLVPHGQQILRALCAVRNASTMPSNKSGAPALTGPPTLKLFKDSNLLSVAKAFAKKFPDIEAVSKSSKEYKEFVESFKDIKEELRPIYLVFSAWAEFVGHARSALAACAQLTCLSLETNPDLTENLLFLSHYLVSSLLLLARIGKGKKAIASAIVILDARTGMVMDSSFAKIAELFVALDKPYQLIADIFAPISPKLTQLLGSVKIEVSSGPMATVETLRKSGMFGMVGMATAEPTAPTPVDIRLRMLTNLSTYSQSIVTVLFACANDMSNDQNAQTLMKLAISNGTFSGIGSDEGFQVAAEIEALVKFNNKLGKLKTPIIEAVTKQKQSGSKFHRDRREYLTQQLSQMVRLCCDNPALLGPKFPLVLSAMNFARDEILHYFQALEDHKQAQSEKGSSSKKAAPIPNELDVLHLLHLLLLMRRLVLENQPLIVRYQCSLVLQSYSASVHTALDMLLGQEQLPEQVLAIAFRINWARLQVYLSLPACMVPINSVPTVTRALNEVCLASQAIDQLTPLVVTAADLHPLLKHADSLLAHINDSLAVPLANATVPVLDIVAPLAVEFATVASPDGTCDLLASQPAIDKALEFATQAIDKFASVTATAMMREAQFKARLDRKATWDGIAMKAKVASNEPFTSAESTLAYGTHPCKPLEVLRMQISDLVGAFAAVPMVTCAAFEIRPVVQLQKALLKEVNAMLYSVVYDTEANHVPPLGDDMPYAILPPTAILVHLESVFSELFATLALIPDFPLAALLESALLDTHNNPAHVAIYSQPLPEQLFTRTEKGKRNKPGPPRAAPHDVPYVVALAHWYAELLTLRLWTSGIQYSPVRNGLVGTKGMQATAGSGNTSSASARDTAYAVWRPDMFVDPVQLAALSRLIGPQGTQLLDSRMAPYVMAAGASVIAQVNAVVGHLSTPHAGGAGALVLNLGKLRGTVAGVGEDVTDRLASLGALLEARRVVRTARADESKRGGMRPVAVAVEAACAKVKAGGAAADKWQGLFDFAEWLGMDEISDSAMDQVFDFMKQLNPTVIGVPTLVTYLATCLCLGALNDNATYNAALATNANKSHSVAMGVYAILTRGLKKMANISPDDCERIKVNVFSMACEWLLLLHRASVAGEAIGKDKDRIRDVESAWMVVHRLARLVGADGELWMEEYAGISLDKLMHAGVIRRALHNKRRRLVGSRGQLLDQEDAE